MLFRFTNSGLTTFLLKMVFVVKWIVRRGTQKYSNILMSKDEKRLQCNLSPLTCTKCNYISIYFLDIQKHVSNKKRYK